MNNCDLSLLIMRSKNRQWLFVWMWAWVFLVVISSCHSAEPRTGVFSPHMDYDQWTPLGMGDPLKNDPTYDYVPPVLERVHYWVDPLIRKSEPVNSKTSSAPNQDFVIASTNKPTSTDNQQLKTDILVLGVSSKNTSNTNSQSAGGVPASNVMADSRRDIHQPFFKFVDAPKLNNYQRQHATRPQYMLPSYYSSYYSKKKHISDRPYHSSANKREQPAIPNTLLMPPPLPGNKYHFTQIPTPTMSTSSTITDELPSFSTTLSSITVQEANLIFQQSTSDFDWSQEDSNSPQDDLNNYYTVAGQSSSLVTWRTPVPSANTTERSSSNKHPAESYIHIQQLFSQNQSAHKPLVENVQIEHSYEIEPTLMMSTSLTNNDQIVSPDIMHKGLVDDDAMDIANTYVNIGKPEAQVDSSPLGISGVSVEPPQLQDRYPPMVINPAPNNLLLIHSNRKQPLLTPPTVVPQTVKTYRPPYVLHALLKKEITYPPMILTSTTNTTINHSPPKNSSNTIYVTTPSPTLTTSTVTTLTTDPLFRHYKQPSEPIRGPMYLIIQGHSKVKTYGPVKQIHGVNIQETNEISLGGVEDNKVEDEYQVKHLHRQQQHRKSDLLEKRLMVVRGGRKFPYNLQTLVQVVQTKLGAVEGIVGYVPPVERKSDVQVAEVGVRYEVAGNATTEKYHKGIVEKEELVREFQHQKQRIRLSDNLKNVNSSNVG